MSVDLNKIRGLVEPVVVGLGLEFVDTAFVVEHGRRTLRVFVDKVGGVSVQDCQSVSREIETLLDVEGVVGDRYDLEVSSPGLKRPLVKKTDYERFQGRLINVKTREPIEGRRNYKGTLKNFDGSIVTMEIDGKDYRVPFELIQKAHLEISL